MVTCYWPSNPCSTLMISNEESYHNLAPRLPKLCLHYPGSCLLLFCFLLWHHICWENEHVRWTCVISFEGKYVPMSWHKFIKQHLCLSVSYLCCGSRIKKKIKKIKWTRHIFVNIAFVDWLGRTIVRTSCQLLKKVWDVLKTCHWSSDQCLMLLILWFMNPCHHHMWQQYTYLYCKVYLSWQSTPSDTNLWWNAKWMAGSL